MAYNNYFPATYQQPQYYPQYQQVQPVQQMTMQNNQQAQQQMMTPPTIHAEIVQVGSKQDALNFPVGAGQAQMMMERDDSAIYIKSAFPNGQSTLIEYQRKVEEPEKPNTDFITREEFEQRLSELEKPKAVRTERKTKENESNV